MTKLKALHRKWSSDPEYRAAYDALDDEYALAAALIDARARAELTQEQVAARMQTTQAYVAKLESGRMNPSMKTLKRFADATGARLKITFEADSGSNRG